MQQFVAMQSSQPRKSMVAKIDGDLILGGLFSLHRRYMDEECRNLTSPRNIMRVEAMMYAVDEVRCLHSGLAKMPASLKHVSGNQNFWLSPRGCYTELIKSQLT